MKRLLLAALLATGALIQGADAAPISSPGDPALSGATVINFDNIAAGNYTSLTIGNATFLALTNNDLTICDHCGGNGFGDTLNSLNNRDGNLAWEVDFASPISAFGVSGGAYNTDWSWSAYNSSNTLIETITVDPGCCGGSFNGIAAPGISKVVFTPNGSDWVVYDNFTYVAGDATPAPEPASMALFGAGLAGLGFMRRRKGA